MKINAEANKGGWIGTVVTLVTGPLISIALDPIQGWLFGIGYGVAVNMIIGVPER